MAGPSRERPSSSCWRRRERWTPGVIIQPLEKEFGWRLDDISSALALRLALFGLIAPFSAAFINRFGVRPVDGGRRDDCVGILASMAMNGVWQLVVFWGVIVDIGTGMVALVLGATVATRSSSSAAALSSACWPRATQPDN